ncbi:MAG: hypothetical protein GX807_03845 [Erysipelotrichia bacterium]|nr:hypothetical protein [Erysipelotrichia bacterium]
MNNSILNSMKQMLGIDLTNTAFDSELIVNINSIFFTLTQLGLNNGTSFSITDASATWPTFLSSRDDLDSVKSYMYLRLRLLFDIPSTSFIIEAMKRQIEEFEWRLNVQAEQEQET